LAVSLSLILKKRVMKEEKETEQDISKENVAAEEISDEQNIDPVEELSAEELAENKYAELNDKYIRIHAEFDNYRKRTNREKIDIIENASASVLKDIIPVIDDFERAIKNNSENDDIVSVKEGFDLIFNKILTLTKSKGLTPMDSIGKEFDVEIHEAIAKVPAPSKKLKGKVIDAVEKGYTLNEKVVRFAKVVVGE